MPDFPLGPADTPLATENYAPPLPQLRGGVPAGTSAVEFYVLDGERWRAILCAVPPGTTIGPALADAGYTAGAIYATGAFSITPFTLTRLDLGARRFAHLAYVTVGPFGLWVANASVLDLFANISGVLRTTQVSRDQLPVWGMLNGAVRPASEATP